MDEEGKIRRRGKEEYLNPWFQFFFFIWLKDVSTRSMLTQMSTWGGGWRGREREGGDTCVGGQK